MRIVWGYIITSILTPVLLPLNLGLWFIVAFLYKYILQGEYRMKADFWLIVGIFIGGFLAYLTF